ncbi:MAG: hypothetical protein VW397_07290 [Candidatus Margulisiibacteriota bacterium]
MNLTDYNPSDQLYFLKNFIEKGEAISSKLRKPEDKPQIESFLLSQILNQK